MKVNYNKIKLKVLLILYILLSVNNLLLAQDSSIDIPGCRNPLALNYNSEATVDDGSCEFPKAKGCKDPEACNYEPTAQVNDRNSCQYLDNCGVCDSDPDNDCVKDCKGNWGGSAIEDCAGICDGNTILDCSGECGGKMVEDCSGECGGGAIKDCAGICNGDSQKDECGICNGPGKIYECGCENIKSGECDCDGNVLDCNGDCDGNSKLDNCGVCDADSSNDCIQNCNGDWGDNSYVIDDDGNCCKTDNQQVWYIDADSDGLGEIAETKNICFGFSGPKGFVLNNLDCYDELGTPAYTDACGVCNPDTINESCTGCMNPLALNFNDDCYYYSGDVLPSQAINECLFEDNSCYFDYFECCNDPTAINYREDCNFYNQEVCFYGFNIESNQSIVNRFNKLYEHSIEFNQVRFLNLFSFLEKDQNTNYNKLIKDPVNRYNLLANNEYLFNTNTYFFNPKKLLKNKPFYREMKLGVDNNTFLIKEYYKIDLENLNDQLVSIPTGVRISDYFKVMLYKMESFLFREYIINSYVSPSTDLGPSSGIVLYSNDFFSIELKGSITISGSLSYTKQDQDMYSQNNDDFNLNINQTQQFTLSAEIGDRLSITANQNSQSDFEWENALKIMYKGYENEVIKELSIGNINLSLAHGTLASVSGGSSGLFGVKLVTQFGPLTISSVIGREKAIKNSKSFESGGNSTNAHIINDYNFIRNKYFFIDTKFKKEFYPFTQNNTFSPIDNSSYDIKDIILFKKKSIGTVYEEGLEAGVAYIDMAIDDINSDDNTEIGSWSQLIEDTDYRINRQLGVITLLGSNTSEYIAAHYTIINNNPNHEDYGNIQSSGTRVLFDECLRDDNNCCALIDNGYCHQIDGSNYQPGIDYIENNLQEHFQGQDECLIQDESGQDICDNNDFSLSNDLDYKENNGDEGYQNTVLHLKLIKDGSQNSSSKTWHLMLKNIYSLGAYDIDRSSLTVDIVYTSSNSGTDIISSNGNSFLNIFGLDSKNESGVETPGGDGNIDTDNSWIVNLQEGEIWFPFHMPFAYNDPNEPFEEDVTINFSNGGQEVFNRYWGNTHPDLENVFQADLSGLSNDESMIYDSYTDGPAMYYDNLTSSATNGETRFAIHVQHASSSSTLSLGFMVIENSETVLLNGTTRLIKGSDYSIDYFSGNLTLLSERATDPSAEITITYDQNELVSFDQKVLVGSYMEYKINDFTDIYGGLYYYSQTLAEEKVDVGYEPMENILWHIGANYQKDFKELTNRINENTNFSFQKNISFKIGTEFAQVFPNPNPLGKAYIDDFEASEVITTIDPNRYDWKISAPPSRQDMHIKNRVDMYYYNPFKNFGEVQTNDIWPNIEVTTTANNQTTRTLWIELDQGSPDYLTDFCTDYTSINQCNELEGCVFDEENGCYKKDGFTYWNGITYTLNKMDWDQTKNKYVDIWMNVDVGDELEFHIDLGVISEDINLSSNLDSEDIPVLGIEGNGILEQGEDVGLDGCEDIYEDGWGGCLGSSTYCESDNVNNYIINPDCSLGSDIDPNRDNYYYDNDGEYSYSTSENGSINGTENNGSVNRNPDTEDLNGNNSMNNTNKYFTVKFNPNEHIYNYACEIDPVCNAPEQSYVELESGAGNAWKLYRIPIIDFEDNIPNTESGVNTGSVGNPSLSEIKQMRIWLSTTNLSVLNKVKIAKIEIVGNEWQELGLANSDEIGNIGYNGVYLDSEEELLSTDDISIEVVNNEEDSNYISPSGVFGEYDEYQGRFTKEQALSINFSENGIGENESYFINKVTGYSTMDNEKRNSFFTYKNLEMFVKGSAAFADNDDVEYCIRLGRENNYYEIRQPFLSTNQQDWDSFKLDLEALSRYKYDNKESYQDFGVDGCLDEYEAGDDTCIPSSINMTNEEICSYDIDCSMYNSNEIACTDEDNCQFSLDNGECISIISYDYLFNDECHMLLDTECLNTNGCYLVDGLCSSIINTDICQDLSDPNNDNQSTQGNNNYDEGEIILYDSDKIGVYDGIPEGSYDINNELWYWDAEDSQNINNVCYDCNEIRVKGEPSVSRIDYIMFGIINESNETIYGKVYLNEIRLTGVKKESGKAYKIDASFDFGDLFTIGGYYKETDANFHALEKRFSSTDHTKKYQLSFSLNLHEFFKKNFYSNPISITYNRTIRAPKYKTGTDIYFGSISNTPSEQINNSDEATLSTSFQTKLENIHDNFLFTSILDPSKLSYSLSWYSRNNPSQGYEEQTNFQHTTTYSYKLTFDDHKLFFFKQVLDKERWIDNKRFLISGMRDFNISLVPTKIEYNSKLIKTDGIKVRTEANGGTETYDQTLYLDRTYTMAKYKLFNDFTIDYSRSLKIDMKSSFDNQSSKIVTEALFNAAKIPGQLNQSTENFTFQYIPTYLNIDSWLSPKFTYSPKYIWKRVLGTAQTSSASISMNGGFDATFNLSITKFIERFYTSGSSSSNRRSSRNSRTSNSNTKSYDKPFEAKNIYMKSFLKMIHTLSKKLSGFNISVSHDKINEYNNVNPSFDTDYMFRLGIDNYPIELDSLGTIQQNLNQSFIYSNQVKDEFRITTSFQVSPKISITNIEYKKTINKKYPSNSDTTITKIETYFPQGLDGKQGLPIVNWGVNVSNLQDFWTLDNWFKNIMISHQFNGTKEESYKNSDLQLLKFTKNFNPYLGFTFNFRNPQGMTMSVYNNKTLTINNQRTTNGEFQIGRIISEQVTFSLDWTKKKKRDLKLFNRRLEIENEFTISLDVTLDDSYSEVSTQDIDIFEKTSYTKSLLIKPGFTYGFSDWVDGTFYFSHKIMETHTTNKKDESTLGFDLRIYFESRSRN
ncbi:MAG: cell surface protein SprA [Candidatus Marinimicrobia bacterium]|nr:cell surface protein SprA [Candidatus Neomarinimicrobiota bacterium]